MEDLEPHEAADLESFEGDGTRRGEHDRSLRGVKAFGESQHRAQRSACEGFDAGEFEDGPGGLFHEGSGQSRDGRLEVWGGARVELSRTQRMFSSIRQSISC